MRLSVLFSYLNNLYEPEELYRGTIAEEIIKGPAIPLWEYLDYRVEYFPGGVLTTGILAVPFFLLFGPTYIALKLVGLMFALGTFILWYVFIKRFFGGKSACLCALLFIFCVPFYTKTSLINWGSHPEANFFTVLSILIFCAIFFRSPLPHPAPDIDYFYQNSSKQFFFLGLTAGFALWFVQTYLLTITMVFMFWFAFDRRFFLRRVFLVFSLGFLVGFFPAIYYALFYQRQIFGINGSNMFLDIIFCDLRSLLPKLGGLLVFDLPQSFLFEGFPGLDRRVLSYSYYLVFLAGFIYLLWISRRQLWRLLGGIIYPVTLKEVKVTPSDISPQALILAYPLLFFLVYALSSYSVTPYGWESPEVWLDYIGYRYIIPLIPFIMVITGLFIGRIKNRLAYGLLLCLVLGLGLIGNFSIVSLKDFGRFFSDKGYSYNIIGDKIGLRITNNLKEYIGPFEKIEPGLRRQFYEGLGAGIAWRLKDESIDKVMRIFETEINPEYLPDLYRGWGTLFFPLYPEEYKRALYIGGGIPFEYRPPFYEGFGRNMDFAEDINGAVDFIRNIDRRIDKIYHPAFYVGVGYSIGFEFKTDPDKMNSLINAMDKRYYRVINQGIILGIRER
jgi:hypothetical protein